MLSMTIMCAHAQTKEKDYNLQTKIPSLIEFVGLSQNTCLKTKIIMEYLNVEMYIRVGL
jgi:hypothetical protein